MKSFLVAIALISLSGFAQIGPGGVGTTLNNGLWLRADALNLANGAAVTSWTDNSTYGLNADNTIPAQQPTFLSSGNINGRPTIQFDGSDQLIVTDNDVLDNSSGLTYYTVVRPTGLNGAPRGILGKRITFTVNTEYAYTLFFWSSNYLNLDLATQNNRFNTNPTTFSNGVNYMPGFIFDGSLAAAQRSRIYQSGNLIVTSLESSTTLPNSNQDLCIGALNVNYGTYFIGEMAEICQWNYALNTAQRIIVENYLGAKYNLAIANDFYVYQASHAGEVAGIGRVDASNLHNDAQGSAIVRINTPSDLGNNEYLIWGHDEVSLFSNNIVDIDGVIIQSRLARTWRVDETGDVGTVTISFDVSSISPLTGSDLRLLIDRDDDGFFDNDVAPQSGTFAGGIITFTLVDFQAGDYFTLGSINYSQTPLPIELLNFNAEISDEKNVDLTWQTVSESNNDYFEIERSANGIDWQVIKKIDGAGNSVALINYKSIDVSPYFGISYYRLKQTDFDGLFSYSDVRSINIVKINPEILIYPNPASVGAQISIVGLGNKSIQSIKLYDCTGRLIMDNTILTEENTNLLSIDLAEIAKGNYLIHIQLMNEVIIKKIVMQ